MNESRPEIWTECEVFMFTCFLALVRFFIRKFHFESSAELETPNKTTKLKLTGEGVIELNVKGFPQLLFVWRKICNDFITISVASSLLSVESGSN